MNKLLLAAYYLQKLRPDRGVAGVCIVTDDPAAYPESECRRMFSPWSDAFRIDGRRSPQEISKLGASPGQILIALSDDKAVRASLEKISRRTGAHCVVPDFPPTGTLDSALMSEVWHFDFEYGGKNEWDGAPTQSSAHCLRHLSCAHSRDCYPEWVFESLPRRRLKVMDIGCGPVSLLRWGAIQGYITITGVDPNLDMYAVVLARHGLDALPKMRCDREINGFAEDLDDLLPDNDFDVIYTQNALDHTQDPVRVLENISRKLAPHGVVAFQVATREGTRQNWDQFHKTDIYLQDGVLMYAHQDGQERPLLSAASGLRLKHVHCNTPDWLACGLERNHAA
jgi:SAM-dependent methyltransferase